MSRFGFVNRVRRAASPFSAEAWATPERLLDAEFEQAAQFADIWLAPGTVKGFAEAEWTELPAADRDRLTAAVDRLRAVAAAVPPGARATEGQVREALPAFATILGVVKSEFADDEALAVRSAIWRACAGHRDWILAFDLELKGDSEGDPAAWVQLILRDDVDVESRDVQLRLYDVRQAVWREFDAAGIGLELYTSVWTRSEVPEVQAWELV